MAHVLDAFVIVRFVRNRKFCETTLLKVNSESWSHSWFHRLKTELCPVSAFLDTSTQILQLVSELRLDLVPLHLVYKTARLPASKRKRFASGSRFRAGFRIRL